MTVTGPWHSTRVPDADFDASDYYATRRPPTDGGGSDSDSDSDDTDGGEYECLVCGYETDIDNEHGQQAKHWCQGECNEITTFTRNSDQSS